MKEGVALKQAKEWFWTVVRFAVLSILAFMAKGLILIPFTDMTLAAERYSLTAGWYVYYAAFASIILFYVFAAFWMFKMQRFDPDKVSYLERTRDERGNNAFSFKATYKETLCEVLHDDLRKYALFSALPTVAGFCSWLYGMPPQTAIFSELWISDIVSAGYHLCRVPHAFFDLFIPFGMVSILLGLVCNLAVFVVVYTLIVTLYRKSLWESAEGRIRSRRLGRGARSIAIFLLVVLVIGWYGRMAGWFDEEPIVNKQPSAKTDVVRIMDLGIPYSEQYPSVAEGDQSRIPWDMKLFDGKLYVGAGNYNDNTGPIGLRWYDTKSRTWGGGSFIFEEQIHTFCVLDGILTIPGTDAVSGFDWDYSSYYQLLGEEWEQYRVLPDARHNFDIVRFGDDIFAAIGTEPGLSPLLVSHDDGQSFEHVPLTVNGNTVNTAPYVEVRSYFLFEHQGELYALITLVAQQTGSYRLVAKYDPQAKEFIVGSEFDDITRLGTALGMRHTFFAEAVTWRDTAYFTNGKLIRFDGEKLISTGALDEHIVWDLLVTGDDLYLLTSTGEDTKTITVYKTENGNDFEGVFSFDSDMYAVSFEMDDRYIYFGMADTLNPHSGDTGRVYMAEYSS